MTVKHARSESLAHGAHSARISTGTLDTGLPVIGNYRFLPIAAMHFHALDCWRPVRGGTWRGQAQGVYYNKGYFDGGALHCAQGGLPWQEPGPISQPS